MPTENEKTALIKASAEHTLKTLEQISETVTRELERGNPRGDQILANPQGFTGGNAEMRFLDMQEEKQRALYALAREPAVCRLVVLNEENKEKIYYISRTTAVTLHGDAALASYRSPIGRMASFSVGDECTLNIEGRESSFEIREKVKLKPQKTDSIWDSLNNAFIHVDFGAFNIESLRNVLRVDLSRETALLQQLLADDGKSAITAGLRRDVLSKMGLRDQPYLDKFQDEIFREHLCSQLLITGPPGTGKTTTLIKRLGQKLDIEYLDVEEKRIVEEIARDGGESHKTSWLMFTPTELLKQYVKEAFAKENIPASGQRLKTWEEYRRHLARNVLDVLKTSSSGGSLVLKNSLSILNQKVLNDSGHSFDQFYKYLIDVLYDRLLSGLLTLKAADSDLSSEIAESITRYVSSDKKVDLVDVYSRLFALEKRVVAAIRLIAEETDKVIDKNAAGLLRHESFFTDFAVFLDSIEVDESIDEEDDDSYFDDDDTGEPEGITTPKEAIQKYRKFLKTYSRSRAQNHSISEKSKSGKIIQWMGERLPTDEDVAIIGKNVLLQNGLRRFVNPARGYVRDVAKIFRKFRKQKLQDAKWYSGKPEKQSHISPLELDFIILAILRNARELLKQSFVKNNIDDLRFEFLKSISKEFRNQILVDEATDFSSIQLAIMFNLTHLRTKSFFACGDFNQRITNWGCQTKDQLDWISKGIFCRSINISYRQSRYLNDFSNSLLRDVLQRIEVIELPVGTECEGVMPVLLTNVAGISEQCTWLRDRIIEIEQMLHKLPSVAILVNHEALVQPIAAELNEVLSDKNIQAVACPLGQAMGNDNDVRVFDIQHIKGLEFEAVFFMEIDGLAKINPELFDKYLYVGATRAATYLGLTCSEDLPSKLVPLSHKFAPSFSRYS